MILRSSSVRPVSEAEVAKISGSAAPYAAVGRALIERADLLLCVWNGTPPRGPGGTSEVAALMLERGGLVLWIAVGAPGVKLIGPAPLPRAGSFRRKLHEALAARFERVARPLEMRVGEPIPTAGLTLRDMDTVSAKVKSAIESLHSAPPAA